MNKNDADIIKHQSATSGEAKLHWFHWLVVASSLLLTVAAWQISKQSVEAKIFAEFDREARQVVDLLVERMEKYEDALWAGVALIQAMKGEVGLDEWETFSKNLRIDLKYPGINGIGVIYRILPDEREAYLLKQRETRPDFKIHPDHSRNEFWPITYIEPVEINAQAIGLDMAHEANRYTAAMKARGTGAAQITAPIVLVQDAERTPGFLFFAPFYRDGYVTQNDRLANFIGLVYAPFVVNKLLKGTLDKERRRVGLKIVDGEDVLYNEHVSANPEYDDSPMYVTNFEVELYGRTWVFEVQNSLSFRKAVKNSQPIIILVGGIVIDAMLLTLFILLVHSNRRAYEFIQENLEV